LPAAGGGPTLPAQSAQEQAGMTADPDYFTQNWVLQKPGATGRRGMVVAQARDAALAGVAILDAGGTAADAAVATALALAAVEPWNSGLGGIGFALVQAPGAAAAEMVDFGPVAPRGLDPARFPLTGGMKYDLFPWPEVAGDVNVHGPLSFVIPAAPAGYGLLHQRWGRLPWAEVAAPAVALARRGLAADWYTTLKIANAAAVLRRYPDSAAVYLPDGLPPVAPYQGVPGFRVLGALPATLERLALAGAEDFYRGDLAAAIGADLRAAATLLTQADLADYAATTRPAHTVAYQGHRLHLPGRGTAGPTLARVLAGLPAGGRPDAAWYAALAGGLKSAYAARLAGQSDAEPAGADSCTTHLTVVDGAGMMVSLTTTLLSSMGSRFVLGRSGVLMNNGVMWFDPRPGSANAIAPGRRPLTNMLPFILAKDGAPDGAEYGRPVLAGGASGGRRILAAVAQMLELVARFGLDPETAAHVPRIDVSGPDRVSADRRLAPDVIAALRAGGPVDVVEHAVLPINFACPNLIAVDPAGVRRGISDAASPWSAAVGQAP
jgi:gamma-glutamyltranspeptidase/glutathione hydrolase